MDTLPIILLLLGASVLAVILFRRLNMPPILGYLLVGALIGPQQAASLSGRRLDLGPNGFAFVAG